MGLGHTLGLGNTERQMSDPGPQGRGGLSGRLRAAAGMVFFYKCSLYANDIDHVVRLQPFPPAHHFLTARFV